MSKLHLDILPLEVAELGSVNMVDVSFKAMFITLISVATIIGVINIVDGKEVLDITVRWDFSSEFENGEVLTPVEIDYYTISWVDKDDQLIGRIQVGGDVRSYKIEGIEEGTYTFSIKSKSVYGTESELYNLHKRIKPIVSII